MKHQTSPRKRSSAGATHRKRKAASRPLHKRFLLHPFTVMVLLCVGVLIAGTTYKGFAASYDVTATVPAPLPTFPATITQPVANLHVNVPVINIAGTCPPQSYVKLYRNSQFSGVAQCQSNPQEFQLQTTLAPGANQLQTRVFNVTDQEGPAAPAITVYYDFTTVVPPAPAADPPTTLWVGWIDNTASEKTQLRTSAYPTVSGMAPPYSNIEVIFHSDPVVCKTKANAAGFWSCTLQQALPEGMHTVDVVAVTPGGERLVSSSFKITVQNESTPLLKPAPANPPIITTDYSYQTHPASQAFTWDIRMEQGEPPFQVVVRWGDGTKTTYTLQDRLPFTISHTYTKKSDTQHYTILLTSTDAAGNQSMLQLSAVIKGTGAAAASMGGQGPGGAILTAIREHLWIVWPTYIVVVLMVLSYWLGEQEIYQRFIKRRRTVHHGGKGRGR